MPVGDMTPADCPRGQEKLSCSVYCPYMQIETELPKNSEPVQPEPGLDTTVYASLPKM